MVNKSNLKSSKRKGDNGVDNPRKHAKPVTQEVEEHYSEDDFETEEYEKEIEEYEGEYEGENNEEFKDHNKQSSKEAHAQQKNLRLERKAAKPHAELLQHCKKIWEAMRSSKSDKASVQTHMEELMKLLAGKVVELSFKHDASRIIQTCLKYGNNEQRNFIAKELQGHYIELSKAKYGRFIVLKILKYCKDQRNNIIPEFYGKVQKLITQKDASIVIEEAYSQYSNAEQRANILQEFFGPEFTIFKKTVKEIGSLEEYLKNNELKKDNILKHLFDALVKVINKGTINHSIVHRALLEFFINGEPAQIQEMIGLLKEFVVEILHTKEGSRVAMKCLLYGNVKDRKVIVKSFKSFVDKIAKEEYGHIVLLQLFDCVDDTVLIEKNIISELINHLPVLLNDKFGRRAIAYLIVGRSLQYLSKPNFDLLKDHDPIRLQFSKKDNQVRADELNIPMSKGLFKFFEGREKEFIYEAFPAQILVDTLIHGKGDKQNIIDNITQIIKDEQLEPDSISILEHKIAGRAIKKLVNYKDEQNNYPFAKKIYDAIPKSNLLRFATGNANFVMLSLLETLDITEQVKKDLKPYIKDIKKMDSKGCKLILDKLNA